MTIFQFASGVLGYLGSSEATPRTNWMYVYGTDAILQCSVSLPNLPFDEYLKIGSVVDKFTLLQLIDKSKDKPEAVPLSIGDPILDTGHEFTSYKRMVGILAQAFRPIRPASNPGSWNCGMDPDHGLGS